jgi:hypothetical protein
MNMPNYFEGATTKWVVQLIKAARRLRTAFDDEAQERYLKSFFRNVDYVKGQKRILMYVGIGAMHLTPFEILLYHLFRSRDFEVDYYIYGSDVAINEVITKARFETEGSGEFWMRSFQGGVRKLRAANVDYKLITRCSDVDNIMHNNARSLDEILSFNFDGIPFGKIVEGSLFRFYKALTFDSSAAKYAREFLATALTNYFQVKMLLQRNQYEAILFSHGIYCTWQPVVELLTRRGIDYVCYDRGKTRGYINVNFNNPSPVWDISIAWERYLQRELLDSELAQVDKYLHERILQKGDVYAYNFGEKAENMKVVRSTLGIKDGAKVICIFTNLAWDAANVSRDVAFHSPLDCITQTINHFRGREDVYILIRTHPAEKVLGTAVSYAEMILELFPELPPNVRIVGPDLNINSFTILELANIGVVHTSTVGLEMAIEGKPVILISETHFRNKGFTFDATSSSDYFQILESQLLTTQLKERQVALAKKYFYLMMFKYQQQAPFEHDKRGRFRYRHEGLYDIQRNSSLPINQVLNDIINGVPARDFVRWDSVPEFDSNENPD